MPKDSLSEALFELKERERKSRRKAPKKQRPKRGRPKAFDSFYFFSSILLLLGLALQLVAIALYS